MFFCEHCKMTGHTMDRCFKLKGYPPDFKTNNQKKFANLVQGDGSFATDQGDNNKNDDDLVSATFTRGQYNKLLDFLDSSKEENHVNAAVSKEDNKSAVYFAGKLCLFSAFKHGWIIDSGATDHICYDLSLLNSYSAVQNGDNTITILDGSEVSISQIGKVTLEQNIVLKDVLYVPEFQFNLIYVHKLCRDLNCSVKFTSDSCIIQDHSLTRETVLGRQKSGLYHAGDKVQPIPYDDSSSSTSDVPDSSTSISNHTVTYASSETNNAKLWHLRLGHLPFKQIGYVLPEVKNKSLCDSICQICPKARQTRLSFSSSEIKTSAPFELIHVDI